MRKKKVGAIAIKSFALLVVLGTACLAKAQDATTPYPNMAPVDQYLMTDQGAEIALARSAAPDSISRDADVLILGRHGFETAVKGKNGFVCIVGRGWTSAADPEYWNPKVRVPMCVNAAGARSYLLRITKITELALAGHTLDQVNEAIAKKELPPMEPGAMCYMMSKDAYLNDGGGHNMAHLMFYTPLMDGAVWGANPIDDSNHVSFKFPNSPIFLTPQFLGDPEPMDNFVVPTRVWSDGTPDQM